MYPPRPIQCAVIYAALAISLLFASGCAMFDGRRHSDRSSSIVNYLYPKQANPLPPTSIPVLRVPLRVGVAFVPPADANRFAPSGMSEAAQAELLQKVAAEFKAYPFVGSIEIIPASYLRPQGGFDNLDQIRNLLGVDVIALIAYDQVQFTDSNILSLSYWTIVGAYMFKGNRNDTQTLMEAAVYDIASQHLLFRAPGTSRVEAASAGMYVQRDLRDDSANGYGVATTDLVKNLKVQLAAFRERIKQNPSEVQIEHRPGYTGGGAMDAITVGMLGALALLAGLRRRR